MIYKHLFFILLIVSVYGKIIRLSYDLVKGYYLYIEIGHDSNYFPIDQQNDASYFNSIRSDCLNVVMTNYYTENNKTFKRDYIEDKIKLRKYTFSLSFYKVHYGIEEKKPGGISLSLSSSYLDFSTMHQLKKQGLIDDLLYAFVPMGSISGYLFIGGSPDEFIKDKRQYILKMNNNYWGGNLHYVVFDNGNINNGAFVYYNKDKMIFQAGLGYVYAPQKFIDNFIDKYLKELFENKLCTIVSIDLDEKAIECYKENIKEIPFPKYIDFIIEDYIFRVEMEIFMFSYSNKVRIELRQKEEYTNQWVFGALFLSNYISVYNYDKKEIIFYNQNKENIFHCDIPGCINTKARYNKAIVLIGIIELLLGILMNTILKIK